MNIATPKELRESITKMASEKPVFEITTQKTYIDAIPLLPKPDFEIHYNGKIVGFPEDCYIENRFRQITELVIGEYIRLHEAYEKLKNDNTLVGVKEIPAEENFTHRHSEDVVRMQRVMKENGIEISLSDCAGIWEEYSDMSSARWLSLPENNEDLFNILKSRIS